MLEICGILFHFALSVLSFPDMWGFDSHLVYQ